MVREVLCLRLLQTAWGTGCVPRCHSHFMAVLSLLSQCFIYLHFILIKCVADHYVGKQTIKKQTNQNKQTKILFYLTTVTNCLKNVLSVGICLSVSIPTPFFFFFVPENNVLQTTTGWVFVFVFFNVHTAIPPIAPLLTALGPCDVALHAQRTWRASFWSRYLHFTWTNTLSVFTCTSPVTWMHSYWAEHAVPADISIHPLVTTFEKKRSGRTSRTTEEQRWKNKQDYRISLSALEILQLPSKRPLRASSQKNKRIPNLWALV